MGQIRKKETFQAFISLTSKENKCCCSLMSTKKAPSKKSSLSCMFYSEVGEQAAGEVEA